MTYAEKSQTIALLSRFTSLVFWHLGLRRIAFDRAVVHKDLTDFWEDNLDILSSELAMWVYQEDVLKTFAVRYCQCRRRRHARYPHRTNADNFRTFGVGAARQAYLWNYADRQGEFKTPRRTNSRKDKS